MLETSRERSVGIKVLPVVSRPQESHSNILSNQEVQSGYAKISSHGEELTNLCQMGYLTDELNRLQNAGEIADHYPGNHGAPGQEYQGERSNFDENSSNPEGWKITQRWLESGSEVALNLIMANIRGMRLGPRFNMQDLLHFIANQSGCNHGYDPSARQFFISI